MTTRPEWRKERQKFVAWGVAVWTAAKQSYEKICILIDASGADWKNGALAALYFVAADEVRCSETGEYC